MSYDYARHKQVNLDLARQLRDLRDRCGDLANSLDVTYDSPDENGVLTAPTMTNADVVFQRIVEFNLALDDLTVQDQAYVVEYRKVDNSPAQPEPDAEVQASPLIGNLDLGGEPQ